jgi:ABC-type transport system involved in cytochrome bd biosynthesis fused ATPase/permease subunit
MSDEQTRLLQQILDVQKEQLAFAKRQQSELMTSQRSAIEQQEKALKLQRFAIGFMFVVCGLVIFWVAWVAKELRDEAAKQGPRSVLSPEVSSSPRNDVADSQHLIEHPVRVTS